jgi:hypothetical protein
VLRTDPTDVRRACARLAQNFVEVDSIGLVTTGTRCRLIPSYAGGARLLPKAWCTEISFSHHERIVVCRIDHSVISTLARERRPSASVELAAAILRGPDLWCAVVRSMHRLAVSYVEHKCSRVRGCSTCDSAFF